MNVGKVYLALEGGNIREVKFNYSMYALELIIEHPEMPIREPGYPPETVMLNFTKHQDSMGHSVSIREPIQA
uniref:Uncharacterized protein n=1 Tax=viral metagenome TaxID=1070528 RepID=A0A6M3L5W9_9ZZZZ